MVHWSATLPITGENTSTYTFIHTATCTPHTATCTSHTYITHSHTHNHMHIAHTSHPAVVIQSFAVKEKSQLFYVLMPLSVWSLNAMNMGHVILVDAHVIHHGRENLVNYSTVRKQTVVTMATVVKVRVHNTKNSIYNHHPPHIIDHVCVGGCLCGAGWMGPECNQSE